jgi:uroporphyrin-III C-methyltransferase
VTVHLVGAGPGDPDLLTLRAARLLTAADAVVHDALVSPAVLELVSPRAELIDVGKRAGCANAQELINVLLVRLGRRLECVVRLKGGDPYLFGRGGEEAAALAAAGVAVAVVPGVSSALAAPAAAGIPVTHRDHSPAVTVVTGHRQTGGAEPDWAALARLGHTVVVLMGVARRSAIAAQLLAGGLPPTTPVAAVSAATTADHQVTRTTLAALGHAEVAAPAVLVIGAVAGLDLAAFVPTAVPAFPALSAVP